MAAVWWVIVTPIKRNYPKWSLALCLSLHVLQPQRPFTRKPTLMGIITIWKRQSHARDDFVLAFKMHPCSPTLYEVNGHWSHLCAETIFMTSWKTNFIHGYSNVIRIPCKHGLQLQQSHASIAFGLTFQVHLFLVVGYVHVSDKDGGDMVDKIVCLT